MREQIRLMLKRSSIVPFEMSIAALAVISGFAGLLHWGVIDPINALLPAWEATAFNVVFMLCGLMMTWGVAKAKSQVEAAGLWLLNGVIVSRIILYGYFLGIGTNFFMAGVFNVMILVASAVRSHSIRKRQVLVKVKDGSTLDDIIISG